MPQETEIAGEKYEVLDAKERMTVPDCFVLKNKTGTGHGEAKFYVGNDNKETWDFFDDFGRRCMLLKSDLLKYLRDAEAEYKNPQQPYRNKDDLPTDWERHLFDVEAEDEIIWFGITHQSQIEGPRVYIKSSDRGYKLIRTISLPEVTYLSALKLRNSAGEVVYYFRLFLDYFGEEEHPSEVKEEIEEIEEDTAIADEKKLQIVRARKGQGEYREKLLKECPFCPITLVTDDRILIASHIKPWIKSENGEKTDPKNGFMFTPTYDFLFDRGFISFNDDRTILISPWLSKMTLSKLGLSPGKKYTMLPVEGREGYLRYHRENIFKR